MEIIALILITEFGVVASHVFAASGHAHWAHRPWFRKLHVLNWFHVFSFVSHWPIVLYVLWPQHYEIWLCSAIGSWLTWQMVKRWGGKQWPSFWQQLFSRNSYK